MRRKDSSRRQKLSQTRKLNKRRRNISPKVNRYVIAAREKASHKTWRESFSFVRLLNGAAKDIHKEFMREYGAAMKMLVKLGAFDALEKYSQSHHPELYPKEEKMIKEKITEKSKKQDKEAVDKWFVNWDRDVETEKMKKVLGMWSPKAAKLGGQVALQKLGVGIAFHLKDSSLLAALKDRGEKITGDISKRTLNDFKKVLYESYMEEGISPYEVKKRIEGMFEETYRNRAMAIARTETGIASSVAQHKTYEMNEITQKEWLATMDEKTRLTHSEANGQVVGIDEPFKVGDAELMHPLDPNGPPEEICNCRCDELPVVKTKISDDEAWDGEEKE